MKSRESAERGVLRKEKSLKQRALRATLAYWKLKLREKDGINVESSKMKKEEMWLACS